MKTIEVSVTTDGMMFEDADTAENHQLDLIGIEMDGLLQLFNLEHPRHRVQKEMLKVLLSDKKAFKAQLLRLLKQMEYIK